MSAHLGWSSRDRARLGRDVAEFLCGPVSARAMEDAAELFGEPAALSGVDATLAAHLFNATGRRRGSLADCMISAIAMNARGGARYKQPRRLRGIRITGSHDRDAVVMMAARAFNPCQANVVTMRILGIALSLSVAGCSAWPFTRQTPPVAPAAVERSRTLPYPVFETNAFARAVARGTRTRTGQPGPNYWQQFARYRIDGRVRFRQSDQINGRENVRYFNRSPDTLRTVWIFLNQNLFAPASPRTSRFPSLAAQRFCASPPPDRRWRSAIREPGTR